MFDYALIGEPIARGSQGTIHFATRSDGRKVAIKLAASSAIAAETVVREAGLLRALARAEVSGVVECLEMTQIDGRPAIVMPIYGGDLGSWLEDVVRAPRADTLETVLSRIASIARILGGVHRFDFEGRRLVHRDIKPENIFVAGDRLFLGDFGCAMAIDGLRAVELALYGTPMWAPLDQILPGRAIPDPTWDTYALCVMLYAAITGSRPAYQADPRDLLSPRGRQLWELAKRAIAAKGPFAHELRQAFASERVGATAADLLDCTGRAALLETDRAALQGSVDRLATLAGLSPSARATLARGLWNLLVRGLSPLSHPSPPNRYRDASELAEILEDLATLVKHGRSTAGSRTPAHLDLDATPAPSWRIDSATTADLSLERTDPGDRPRTMLRGGAPWAIIASVLGLGLVAAAWLTGLPAEIATAIASDDGSVLIDGGTAFVRGSELRVDPFLLDRTEVTGSRWAECESAGSCPDLATVDRVPVTGITYAEAQAYCAFAGGRLPTEAEWLRAVGDASWPWGDAEPTCDHAIGKGCADAITPSRTARAGASASGVADLAGNAWEWVEGGAMVGGGWDTPASKLGRFGREIPKKGSRPPNTGVRCAYSSTDHSSHGTPEANK